MKISNYLLIGLFLIVMCSCNDKNQLEKYKAEAQKANDELKTTKSTLEKVQNELNSAKQESEKLKASLENAEKEIANLKNSLENAEKEIANLKNSQAKPANPTSLSKIAESQMKEILKALELYKAENKTYPTTEQGLKVLLNNRKDSKEPYIKQLNKDPWGRDYIYRMANGVCEIRTLGEDGKKGGTGENADIKITSSN